MRWLNLAIRNFVAILWLNTTSYEGDSISCLMKDIWVSLFVLFSMFGIKQAKYPMTTRQCFASLTLPDKKLICPEQRLVLLVLKHRIQSWPHVRINLFSQLFHYFILHLGIIFASRKYPIWRKICVERQRILAITGTLSWTSAITSIVVTHVILETRHSCSVGNPSHEQLSVVKMATTAILHQNWLYGFIRLFCCALFSL